MRYLNLFKLLIACCALTLSGSGFMQSATAAQDDASAGTGNHMQQPETGRLQGKVTNLLTAKGISYVEVDTGNAKVWSAGPADASLGIGDSVTISTSMPMQGFHSNALGRDFPVVYFVRQFDTDSKPSESSGEARKTNEQQSAHAATSSTVTVPAGIEEGGYLREASLDGLNVEDRLVSEYRGKPLIINVWASWCGPCRAEMGSLQHLAQQYNGKRFNLIGISTDDYRDRASDFLDQMHVTFDNYIDHELMMESMLGVKILPLTVLVGADGRVLKKVDGAREWDNPAIVEAIGQVFQDDLKQ